MKRVARRWVLKGIGEDDETKYKSRRASRLGVRLMLDLAERVVFAAITRLPERLLGELKQRFDCWY